MSSSWNSVISALTELLGIRPQMRTSRVTQRAGQNLQTELEAPLCSSLLSRICSSLSDCCCEPKLCLLIPQPITLQVFIHILVTLWGLGLAKILRILQILKIWPALVTLQYLPAVVLYFVQSLQLLYVAGLVWVTLPLLETGPSLFPCVSKKNTDYSSINNRYYRKWR